MVAPTRRSLPGASPSDQVDFRRSERGRKQSWYGGKALVKRVLGWRVPHLLMRRAALLAGGRIATERLPAPAHLRRVRARVAGVSFVMRRPDRCIIAKELYWGGGRRPRAQDQLALEVFGTLSRDCVLVLDIGAYTAVFALLAASVSKDAEVHAYEMVPEVAKAAIDNVVANDMLDRITVHIEGVGRDGETVTMPVRTGGSALPDFYSTKLHFDSGVRVRLRSLDALVATLPGQPGRTIVKIDVEGTEDVVLRNARRFLALRKPDIICELLPGADGDAVAAVLAPHGYRFFRIGERRLSRQEALVAGERHRDWLFTTLTDAELTERGIPIA
jgi:FkbM family methyltransferase